MEGSLNLMLLSGDYAKLHAASMVTLVAASLGQTVNIFVSMEALPGFHADAREREALTKGPVARQIAETASVDYLGLFEQAKDIGDVHLYACSLVADLKDWGLEDLSPLFDDMMGVAGFLGKASTGTSLTF
jgi:peroxiredoxin family protein